MDAATVGPRLRLGDELPVDGGHRVEGAGADADDVAGGRGAQDGLGDLVEQAGLDDGHRVARLGQSVADGVARGAAAHHDVVVGLFDAERALERAQRPPDQALARQHGLDGRGEGVQDAAADAAEQVVEDRGALRARGRQRKEGIEEGDSVGGTHLGGLGGKNERLWLEKNLASGLQRGGRWY